jgi:hypothetical protein
VGEDVRKYTSMQPREVPRPRIRKEPEKNEATYCEQAKGRDQAAGYEWKHRQANAQALAMRQERAWASHEPVFRLQTALHHAVQALVSQTAQVKKILTCIIVFIYILYVYL